MFKKFLILFTVFTYTAAGSASTPRNNSGNKYYVAVCAIFCDEADYLKEWIEFHRLAGVEHFYLYDNCSSDGFKKVLKPYLKSGLVSLYNWPRKYPKNTISQYDLIQNQAYKDCLKRTKGSVKWLAFIDIDEFLFPIQCDSLAEFLREYEKYPGIFVNWQMFGTSGVKKIPSRKLLIETLTLQSETDYDWNRRVKSIVRPSMATDPINPHYFRYRNKLKAVNSDKTSFKSDYSPYVIVDKIRINHYYTRDENHFFNVKVPRREYWYGKYIWQTWFDDLNKKEDAAILKYVPQLRKTLYKE